MGRGRLIPGLVFMPALMRSVLLQRRLGSDSFLKQRHSLGWLQASSSWLGQVQYGLHDSQASPVHPAMHKQ